MSTQKSVTEPPENVLDQVEADVDAAIALCDGDARAALRAALVYIQFLDSEIERVGGLVSTGYARGKISPCRGASKKLDDWREIFRRT